MSENTVNVALRRLGYSKDEMTGHGFRTMASTRLHEMGFHSDHIELQLAHADKNIIRGTYNKALYLEARKKMMQAWADYLDALKADADVIPINRKSG
jgi:integrase